MFLKNSDQAKYGNLINTMNTEYAMGNGKFPKNVTKAVDIMANYKFDNARKPQPKKDHYKKKHNKKEEKKETSFAQTKKDYICYCCGKTGHCSPDCPKKNTRKPGDWGSQKGIIVPTKQGRQR